MVTNSGTDPLFVRLSYGNRMMNVPTKTGIKFLKNVAINISTLKSGIKFLKSVTINILEVISNYFSEILPLNISTQNSENYLNLCGIKKSGGTGEICADRYSIALM